MVLQNTLTIHLWLAASGNISFLQAKHQIISPLDREKTILQVIQPNVCTATVLTYSFIISLCLYFFKQRIPVIALIGLSIVLYDLS
jgi:hypothetical protein